MCGVLTACMIAGLPPLTESVPLVVMASMGTSAAVAWYPSLLPPARYTAFVRKRTAARD
jgi:hypothetical protein